MENLKKAVLDKIDEEGVVRLTSELVKIPSFLGEETPVALFLARECKKLGFEPKLLEVRGYGVPAPGRPNVVFTIKGTGGGPSLMFNGHLDIEPVPPGYEEIGEDPFSGRIDYEDGHIYGIGTMNMKSAVAAYVYAIKALRDAGVELKGDIIFAGVIGEMEYNLGTRFLLHCGYEPDMVICGEPSDLGIAPMSSSSYDFSIRLRGKPAHMGYPARGVHVAPKLAKLIEAISGMKVTYNEKKYKDILQPRVNINYLNGGLEYKTGLFIDEATMNFCVRTPLGPTLKTVMADVEAVLDRLRSEDPQFMAELLPLNPQYPFCPPFEVQLKEYVVQAVRRAHLEVRGKEPHLMFKVGYNDASAIQYLTGAPSCVCGPAGMLGGTGSFTPPERALISEVVDAVKIYALAALDICSKDMEEIRPHYRIPPDPDKYDTSF